jgi:hypothetical protein
MTEHPAGATGSHDSKGGELDADLMALARGVAQVDKAVRRYEKCLRDGFPALKVPAEFRGLQP